MRSAFKSPGLRSARKLFLLAGVFIAAAIAPTASAGERVLVFAAASTIEAMETLAVRYGQETGVAVTVSAAGSGTLARQIEAGAPADIFLSANPDWMDYLEDRNLIIADTRRNLVGNTLVVVAALGEPESADLAELLANGRFAMGDPGHVPAGLYARQALESLGLWPALSDRAVLTENVRVALALAARGEVAHAIVYGSDAAVEPGAAVVYRFASGTHAPIAYPVALTLHAGDDARTFLDFLTEAAGNGFFSGYGFAAGPESD